jgi:drug/metabolite transporter (DMT)-like permease
LLSVVAPVAALYPASTVLLAFLVDRERLRPVQLAGLGLAVTALVLVAT